MQLHNKKLSFFLFAIAPDWGYGFFIDDFSKAKKEILFMQTLDIMLAMQDDAFAEIISNDPILQELEKEKFNATD